MKKNYFKITKTACIQSLLMMVMLLGIQVMQAATLTSSQTGNWADTSTWGGATPTTGDTYVIANTHTVTIAANFAQTAGTVTVNGGGTLVINSGITSTFNSLAVNNVTGPPLLSGVVTNNGTLILTTTLTGTGTFTNVANSTLTVSGSSNSVTTFNATAVPNTVIYNRVGAQTLKEVNYHHLTISGSGTKTFQQFSNRTINGDLTISNGATLLVNGTGSPSTVTSVLITNGGSGYGTTPPTVTFSSGTTTALGTAVLTGGVVTSVTINTAGTGYSLASYPTVTFSTPASGVTATGIAVITNSASYTVSGTTQIDGALSFNNTSCSGSKIFAGAFSNSSTGVISTTSTTTPLILSFTTSGAKTNAGTITPSNLSVGAGMTLTNTGTLDVNNSIAGSGTLVNDATGILRIGGGGATLATAISTLTTSAVGNTVDYNRAGNQTVKSSTYSNLNSSGSGTKTISGATTVNNLTIASGTSLAVNEGVVLNNTSSITNNGDLILKSSTAGTASLLSDASVANVTQQRYLSSNQRGWRLLSNPLDSKTFNTLATASNITIGTNFTGEYIPASNTWTSTDGTVAMDNNKAYKVFITGQAGEAPSYATGPSNVTLVNKGTATNVAPAQVATTTGKYYLVANPYTAPVSVSSIIAASTGLSNSVSYYNPTKTASDVKVKAGGYDNIIGVSGSAGSATDVLIPPMGAIFVYSTSSGTFDVPKSAIFTGTPTAPSGSYTHKTAQTKVATPIALTIDVASNGLEYDKLQLRFKEVGTAGSNVDFGKLPNTFLDLYSIDNSKKMAISELELVTQTIPLGITSTIEKNYTFKVAENTIPAGYEAVLVDNVLNTSTALTPGTNYNFAIDSTPASQGNARFAINLKTAGTLSVAENALDSKIQLWPNPAKGQFNLTNDLNQKEGDSTIEISNVNGQVIHSQKSNPGTTTTIQTNGWASGVYFLKATNNGTQTTKKLIIQ